MSDPLTWIAAVGGVAATVGAWLGPVRTRWQWRAEHARTDEARRDNELHRRRFAEVWNWQRNQPEGPERIDAARWYGEWTGAARPRRGGLDDGPQTPGLHSADEDDAYERYIEFLSAVYEPGRLGAPVEPLRGQLPDGPRPLPLASVGGHAVSVPWPGRICPQPALKASCGTSGIARTGDGYQGFLAAF